MDEEWRSADTHAVETFLWGDSLPDIAAEWRALWDEEALYVLVTVTDSDDGTRDADIERYFDPDNSRGTTYDGENDRQILVPRGAETAVSGWNSAPIAAGTEVETVETDDGWRTMLAIPWANYGVRPVVGHRVGMDVHIP
ncbi:sugar-binding protein [Natrinema sp. LN54]|uniref:sugar-binding protein n=1 Tax=Natrinema sp. LN54 TaxID=3458705 RepID=UPI0040373CDC